ncbi:polysaccharide biosynthesis/export family protein [Amylibacter sp.]|nr:polysaccharide biosynthesis/export family protein [Amylibacter sp.]
MLLSIKKLQPSVFYIFLMFFSACDILSDTNFPVSVDDQMIIQNDDLNIIQLTPENIKSFNIKDRNITTNNVLPETSTWIYEVGIGDRIAVNVWDHPELNQIGNFNNEENLSGFIVDTNGQIFYPYIKNISISGKPVSQIQKIITQKLSKFIPDPQVDVKITRFNSQNIQITGSVENPQSISLTNIPLSLINAVNLSGGLSLDADSEKVTLQRGGSLYEINLKSFIENGEMNANPFLIDGDVINVPKKKKSLAFIMGEIRQPGSIELGTEGINLTEAISIRGGLEKNTANAEGIFVFRDDKSINKLNVFQLDATTPLAFVLATNFYLQPQDVIYIVRDPVARWNAVLETLLPSVLSTRSIQETIGGF